jgi:hypothetical protein
MSRTADQARTDSAAIESELEVIQAPIARLPTGGDLAKAELGIISERRRWSFFRAEAFWHL